MTATRRSTLISVLAIVGVSIFLLAPLLAVIPFAFHSSPRLALPFEGFSTRWFSVVFSDQTFTSALRTSLLVAALVGLFSATIGYLGAQVILTGRRATRTVAGLAVIPSFFPPLLVALGLVLFLKSVGVGPGPMPMVLGQTLIALPFATVIIYSRLRNLDPRLIAASRDLGATQWITFRKVTFPLMRGAIIAAACLAMALSLDEFVIAFFAGAGDPTVPVVLWTLLRRGVDPSANAMATLILVTCLALVITASIQIRKDLENK